MKAAEPLDVPVFRFHDCDTSRPSPELLEAIDDYFEYTIGPGYVFEFSITEEEFYDILSVVDAYNAPILAQLGFRASREVVEFLRRHNLQYLIINNADKTATALRLGVPAGMYMDCYMAAFRKRDANREIIKGLETYAMLDKKPYCRRILLPLMVSGTVRYSDAEAVGYDFLERNREVTGLSSALSLLPLKDGAGREYTAADIRRALGEKTTKLKESRLRLLMQFGADTAFKVKHVLYASSLFGRAYEAAGLRISPKLMLYVDTVYSVMGCPANPSPVLMLRDLYAAGVDAEFAGQQLKENPDVSLTRIIALYEGSAHALTDGWL